MRTLKALSTALGIILGLGVITSVQALDGPELYAKKTCVACHGKDANSPILPVYPKLAGQNPDYAYNQMKDIQSGARNNGQTAAMKAVMHLVTDEEMRTIANWLGTLSK